MTWRPLLEQIVRDHEPPAGRLARWRWRRRRSAKKRAARRLARELGETPLMLSSPLGFLFPAVMQNTWDQSVYREGVHEPHSVLLLPDLIPPGGVVLDVGANVGFYTLLFSHLVGPAGVVHAFEPMTPAYWRMVALHALNCPRFSHPNVVFHQLAASDAPGEALVAFEHEFKTRGHEKPNPPQPVTFTTLDLFMAQQKLDRVDLLKVDVDGHDDKVLAGGMAFLKNLRPRLLLEYGDQNPNMRAIHDTLRGLGYSLFSDRGLIPLDTYDDFLTRLTPDQRGLSNVIGLPPGQSPPWRTTPPTG